MPVFIRREGNRAWLIHYADDNPNRRVAEKPAPPQSSGHGIDSLSGFGAAEFRLTKALAE